MATKTWNGSNADWYTAADWTGGTIPAATDDAVIPSGTLFLQSGDAGITVNSITLNSSGVFEIFDPGQTQSVTGNVTLNGASLLSVDGANIGHSGGSTLTIGGALTNSSTNGNGLDIGNTGITAADTVTVQGTGGLVNGSTSQINIEGSASVQASLNVTDAAAGFGAAGVETGTVFLENDALLEFASGQITTIDGELFLDGTNARVADSGATTTNSALTGLSSNAGTFTVESGSSVTTVGVGLTNTGVISVDGGFFAGGGGSSLTLGGALTNSAGATLDIGNRSLVATSTVQATSLSNAGTMNLLGDGAAAAAAVTLTGGLTNTGSVGIDNTSSGEGGSTVTLGGTLSNSGTFDIGISGLVAPTTVTATGLANTGTIGIAGNTTAGTTNQASLEVAASAPSTLPGNISLTGDALLQFTGTSSIQTIGAGTSLTLDGAQSRVALSSSPTTNSALTGLSSNAGTFTVENGASVTTVGVGLTNTGVISVDAGFFAGGGGSSLTLGGALTNSAGATLDIGNRSLAATSTVQATSLSNAGTVQLLGDGAAAAAAVTLTGGLTNTGSVGIDNTFSGEGGSTVTLGGTLSNSGTFDIGISGLVAPTTVTATGLANTGTIGIAGNTTAGTTNQASLEVAAS